jgi:predicted secreted hydrolase
MITGKTLGLLLLLFWVGHNWAISLPKDHKFHRDSNLEWIYFVGHIKTKSGKNLGFEASFFYSHLGEKNFKSEKKSKSEVFPVHFAISNFDKKIHQTAQVLGRNIGGLVVNTPEKILVHDYTLEIPDSEIFQIHAVPRENPGIGISFRLLANRGQKIFHGENGFSRKSLQNPNFSSQYYSISRIPVSGKILWEGIWEEVESGQAWMDHEWTYANLGDQSNSWDWVGLSLDDGSDWMAFRFRPERKGISEIFGTKFFLDKTTAFDPNSDLEWSPVPGSEWTSKNSKNKYPMVWRLRSKKEDLDISVRAIFSEQEFDARLSAGLIYWEGGVLVEGFHQKKAVKGKGYMELKGYEPEKSNSWFGGLFR